MASDIKDPQQTPTQPPQEEGKASPKKNPMLAVVRERLRQSRLVVQNADPNKEYYWANTHPDELSRYQALGWNIVKGEEGSKLKTRGGPREDGTHVISDVILCQMPKIEFEAYVQLNDETALQMAYGYQEEFLEKAYALGVPAYRLGG